jgi:hypothetical protein
MYAASAFRAAGGAACTNPISNGFGPPFDTSFTLTAQIRRGVSIAPATCFRMIFNHAGAYRHNRTTH